MFMRPWKKHKAKKAAVDSSKRQTASTDSEIEPARKASSNFAAAERTRLYFSTTDSNGRSIRWGIPYESRTEPTIVRKQQNLFSGEIRNYWEENHILGGYHDIDIKTIQWYAIEGNDNIRYEEDLINRIKPHRDGCINGEINIIKSGD